MDVYEDDQTHFYNFLLNEFRTVNYYTIKSSMADTKRIREPKSLYKLPFEINSINANRELFKEGNLFSDEDKAIMKKYGFQI